MSTFSTRNFDRWTQNFLAWLQAKFASISENLAPLSRDIKGADSTEGIVDNIENLPVLSLDESDEHDLIYDAETSKYRLVNISTTAGETAYKGYVGRADELNPEDGFLLVKNVNIPGGLRISNVAQDEEGFYFKEGFIGETIIAEPNKNYKCIGTVDITKDGTFPRLLPVTIGTLYLWEEYTGLSIHEGTEKVIAALDDIDFSDVAKQGSDPSVNITDMDAKLGDVEDALEYIEGGGLPTITAIAKQGTNASATLTTTQAAVVDGNDTAISVGKEVRSEVGTGSDTAAESGTLFAVVKWVKDKVKSIFNLIGSPAVGQPSTLFAAIAAGGGGGGSAAVPEISIADSGSAASQELAANTLYIFPNRTSDLTLTLGTPVQGEASEYHFIVEVGSTLPTITLPAGLTWKSSDTIAFDTDTTYEVSILDNYAIFVVW